MKGLSRAQVSFSQAPPEEGYPLEVGPAAHSPWNFRFFARGCPKFLLCIAHGVWLSFQSFPMNSLIATQGSN